MPIYEYDCLSCGHRFDTLVRRANEKISCPKCGKAKVERRLSVFSTGRGGSKPAAPA